MKKLIVCMLATALMLVCAAPVLAEDTDTPDAAASSYDGLTVAVTTPMTGSFFTSQWGNNTSDMDVRALIHGYNLIVWDAENGMFVTDPTVVSGLIVTQAPDGGRTYTIALYSDITYADGTLITAWDYAFSVLLAISPEMAQLGGTPRQMSYLEGADAYAAGESKELKGLRVLSDDLLSFTVRAEYLPYFYELGLLECNPYPISVIAPGVTVADDGEGAYLKNADANVAEPVFTAELLRSTILDPETGYQTHPSLTSGPYNLVSYADGVAEFELNPLFKGDENGHKPVIQRITFRSMAQEELVPALADGSIDLVNKVTSAQVINEGMKLMGDDLYTMSNYPRSGLAFIAFNADRATADPVLRQAVAYAMNRDALTESTVANYGMRTNGYYGLGQWMYQLLNGNVDYPVDEDADAATQEKTQEQWKALSLNSIEPYEQDANKAAALLEEAGWNLNSAGEPYTIGTDDLRYRKTEAGMEPLSLRLAYAEGSAAGEALKTQLTADLKAVGIELIVEAIPMAELLPQYYHTEPSEYDMFFLATNFDLVYDPSAGFVETEDGRHVWRTTGIEDEIMWNEAVAMRKTSPGDLLTYCKHWLAFQQRFAEVLPIIPVYSNIYFDFYPQILQNYEPSGTISWPQAIISSFFGDPQPVQDENAGAETFTD